MPSKYQYKFVQAPGGMIGAKGMAQRLTEMVEAEGLQGWDFDRMVVQDRYVVFRKPRTP